ncbi:gephyrin-like molybdotransferase Glp [Allonocardiopsis opalescens]|uniref:Molybdopterin molybdenumtransferase n=1 Tax=Allonocardiopsis opalescens TaxID=1144618 RepID=A0A2T0Q972_9ACTN|nr:gephyrin-like molybdotransferase Glp [Allonocardiopsis opalescens]PRY00439.1 molybdopterin molybdochelatase [Allonocardiopsis opalescens]
MKTVEQHIADILSVVQPVYPIELDLLRAYGGVLAEPITADVALPPFDNSAMDGYAVRMADVAAAGPGSPVKLPVVADIGAGDGGVYAIRDGMAARIMTGAPLPAGAEAVVPVEWTDGGIAEVLIRRAPRPGNAVRRAGDDVRPGTVVLRRGTRVGSAELGLLASVGRKAVKVHPRPRVVVLSTGTELVEPGRPIGPGQIWESNSFALTAAAMEAGCAGSRHGFISDDPGGVLGTIEDLLAHADVLITTGGVSMGAHDVVKDVLSRLGTVSFERVAMQPGMPQGWGTVGEAGTPIFTLPGNPVSAYVSFQLFVRPALARLQGLAPEPLPSVRARLTAPVSSPEGRRSYLRSILEYGPDGYVVAPVTRQGSHQFSALAETNALIVVPEPATSIGADQTVEVMKLPNR